jgi:hypothetical protein
MKRSGIVRIAGAMGVAAACTFGLAAIASADSHDRKDVEIEIDDDGVRPAVAKVAEGGTVAFDNDSESLAAVAFPISITKSLECKDARPQWQTESEALVSMPLEDDAPDLVLPCALKKGEYPFKVRLFDRIENMDNPRRTLEGKLVVE